MGQKTHTKYLVNKQKNALKKYEKIQIYCQLENSQSNGLHCRQDRSIKKKGQKVSIF